MSHSVDQYLKIDPLSLKWICVISLRNHLCVIPSEFKDSDQEIQSQIVSQYETQEERYNNLHPNILFYFPNWIKKLNFIINPTHLFNELHPRQFTPNKDLQEIIKFWNNLHFFTTHLNTLKDCKFCLENPWGVCSKHSYVNCEIASLLKEDYLLTPLETLEKIQELFPIHFPQDSEIINIVWINRVPWLEEKEKTIVKGTDVLQRFLKSTIKKLTAEDWKKIVPPEYCINCEKLKDWYCDVHATLIQVQLSYTDLKFRRS